MQNFISNLSSVAKASLGLALMLLPAVEMRAAGPFTVNTAADSHAVSPGSSPSDSNSKISLRSAIEAANAQSGATQINVPAGTYNLTLGELDVAPAGSTTLTVIGAAAATTVIRQSDGKNRVFNIDSTSAGGATATLLQLTIEGGTDKADNFGGAAILAGSLSSTPVDVLNLENCTIQNNHCQALNSLGNPGGGVSMEGGSLNVTDCTITNNSSGSSQGAGIFFFPQNSVSILSVAGSTFSGNSLSDVTGAGVGGGAIYIGSTAANVSHTISSSTFNTNSVKGTVQNTVTYGAIQVQDSGAGNNLVITGCSFVGNSVTSEMKTQGLGGALAVNSGNVSVNYCRFFDNTADAGSAIFSSVLDAASINATENWWGCNGGPGATGCESITGDAGGGSYGSTVTFTPWIVLSLTPNPNAINTGANSILTASFLQDSAAQAITPSSVGALDGVSIGFNNPVLGFLSGAQSVIQTSGTAAVTFTAGGTPGTGQASATVDNATVTAGVTINGGSVIITMEPIDTSDCNGSIATFTAAATGTPTPTLQWQVSSGGGPFADISGATSSPLSVPATSTDNGNQYRAVFSNGSSVDSAAATLTVYSPPVAGMDSLGTVEGVAVNAPVPKLLANDSSPIGGALSIVGVTSSSAAAGAIGVTSPSAAGGTVVLNGQTTITYTPPAGYYGPDSFNYTLSDTRCTSQGTVNITVTPTDAPSLNKISVTVTAAGRVVDFAGIPGVTYVVQWTGILGGSWTDFGDGTIVAGTTGLIQYTDSMSPVPPTRFYRTRVGP